MKEGGRVSVTHYQYHIKGGGVGGGVNAAQYQYRIKGGWRVSVAQYQYRIKGGGRVLLNTSITYVGLGGKCWSIPVSHKRGWVYQYHIKGGGCTSIT